MLIYRVNLVEFIKDELGNIKNKRINTILSKTELDLVLNSEKYVLEDCFLIENYVNSSEIVNNLLNNIYTNTQ